MLQSTKDNGNESSQSTDIEEITPNTFKSFNAKEDTSDFVTRFRTKIAGFLALGLWSSLVIAGGWHARRVSVITDLMLIYAQNSQAVQGEAEIEVDFEAFDKAFVMVGDTAKTLYAVVSPLATAATGFYFVSQSGEQTREE
ncbi:MAG: hypothetical protein AAFP09_01040 [Cyanobacteria bacterium J06607_10]